MINYTIEETGSKIIYKLPEKCTIKNLYNRTKFINNTKENNIKIENGKDYRIISNISLETITVDDTEADPRLIKPEDITLGFKLTNDEQIELQLPEKIVELEEDVQEICDPRFTIGYTNFYDFIEVILFDLVYNSEEYIKLVEENLITPTLTLSKADTESLTNATLTVTATDPAEQAIKDLVLAGNISDGTTTTELEETTDSSGEVTITVESAGTYTLTLESVEDTSYASVKLTEEITVEAIPPAQEPPAEEPPAQDPQNP